VEGLLRAGAQVRLISETPIAEDLRQEPLEIVSRPYREGDLEGAFLAFAATDNPPVNAAVAAEARRRGIPVNIADDPGSGDFVLPANLRRGDLLFSVATGGRSPALAAILRDQLAGLFGPEWSMVLDIAAALRQKRLTPLEKTKYNQEILRQLVAGGLPGLVAGHDWEGVDALLARLLGEGCTLNHLGIHPPKGMP
jgi:precorrin-2 dehydrogenase/sirohydrochlorin ferrochelatase